MNASHDNYLDIHRYREQGLTCRSYLRQNIPRLDDIRTAEIEDLCDILEAAELIRKRARSRLQREARKFPQISRFQEIPGIGLIRAATFFAIIDTPLPISVASKTLDLLRPRTQNKNIRCTPVSAGSNTGIQSIPQIGR